MPFANASIDSDSVNPMADLGHQIMVSTNTTLPNNRRFYYISCVLINARSFKKQINRISNRCLLRKLILLQSLKLGWMKVFMIRKFYHLDIIFTDETGKVDVVEGLCWL